MNSVRQDLWIFAYGSLMWRPDFPFVERVRARLTGYSRRFCVTSVHHRGSPARPGLVLGLDRGGVCDGVAYRVSSADRAGVLGYLRAREQVNGVYREAHVAIEVLDPEPRHETAVAYLVERAHPSYAGRLSLLHQARLISGARGLSGVNLDYVVNTLRHMAELGIREPELERLMIVIGAYFANDGASGLVSRRAEALRRTAARTFPAGTGIKRMRPCDRRRFVYRQKLAD